MWRWSESLNFLRAGDFSRTRPLSVSAFPRLDSSMAFERRDDRADCVRDTVNRVGRRRWKRSSVALSAAASTTSMERMEWAFIDSYEERGISTTFVGWLLCDNNRCSKLRKFVEKNTNNGERTIHRRGKDAQVAKNKSFPLTCCWGRHLYFAWSCPKSLSTPSRTSNWRKMRANSGKSTATVVDLRAVVRRWVNFLHALDIIKTTDTVLSSIDLSRSTLRIDTRMCSPLEKQADKSPSLDRFRFHRTELQLQLRLFHPPYCTPLPVVASTEWLHYFAKQKKWEQNRRQTTMKKCYSFQKPSLDA